jgi:ProP effector
LFWNYRKAFGFDYIPLAIGIHREVLAVSPGPISGRALRKAIRMRCRHAKYLMALARDGAWRHDIYGQPVEPVAYADLVAARKLIAARKRRVTR